jgi:hypothetical protein
MSLIVRAFIRPCGLLGRVGGHFMARGPGVAIELLARAGRIAGVELLRANGLADGRATHGSRCFCVMARVSQA